MCSTGIYCTSADWPCLQTHWLNSDVLARFRILNLPTMTDIRGCWIYDSCRHVRVKKRAWQRGSRGCNVGSVWVQGRGRVAVEANCYSREDLPFRQDLVELTAGWRFMLADGCILSCMVMPTYRMPFSLLSLWGKSTFREVQRYMSEGYEEWDLFKYQLPSPAQCSDILWSWDL